MSFVQRKLKNVYDRCGRTCIAAYAPPILACSHTRGGNSIRQGDKRRQQNIAVSQSIDSSLRPLQLLSSLHFLHNDQILCKIRWRLWRQPNPTKICIKCLC